MPPLGSILNKGAPVSGEFADGRWFGPNDTRRGAMVDKEQDGFRDARYCRILCLIIKYFTLGTAGLSLQH